MIAPPLLLVVLVLSVLDHGGWFLHEGGDRHKFDGRSVLVQSVPRATEIIAHVPDGPHGTTRIRLLGIRDPTPGDSGPGGARERLGVQAWGLSRSLCAQKVVTLRLVPHRLRDSAGRLLAYVILPDGSLLNERLVAAGLAHADPLEAHRWQRRFSLIEQQARHDQVGMWAGGQAVQEAD